MKHTTVLLFTSVMAANFGGISAAPSTPVNQAKPAKEAPEYWDANTWDRSGAKDFWHSTKAKAEEKASSKTTEAAAKPAVKRPSPAKSTSSRKDSPSPKKES